MGHSRSLLHHQTKPSADDNTDTRRTCTGMHEGWFCTCSYMAVHFTIDLAAAV
jgi:hypothetical protein